MYGFLMVAIGGAIGASGRHLFGITMLRLFGSGFPWGTLSVNIVGSFLMGVLVELMALKLNISNEFRLFLATGILGGFTTFSAFSLEVALMIERKQFLIAGAYAGASIIVSVAALFAGLALVRALL
ncbi:MAG: fluoride efflux transporter CrcB [Hyphomicrobiales bacterium]